MLKLSMLEFFLRLIPESLLFILAAYTFSKTKIDRMKYFISTFMLMGVILIVRFLPINYGVHTLVNIIMLTMIITIVNRIDIIKAIKSSLVTTITLFICEAINVLILLAVYGENFKPLMENVVFKTVSSLPSLILFAIIVVYCYKYLNRNGKLEHV